MLNRKLFAEAFGTFWLVFGGCGAAVIAANVPEIGIGLIGVSLAFGFTVLTMAYSVGAISGCHLNPAVTIGLAFAGRHSKKEIIPYIIAQFIGATLGAGILFLIASGKSGVDVIASGFATNGYGQHSPGGYSLLSCLVTEVVASAVFLFVILSVTDKKSPAGFAPISIGLCLSLIHLITIPVTNTSVNPARSLGPAIFVRTWALEQLWLFVFAPVAGAIIGVIIHKVIHNETRKELL